MEASFGLRYIHTPFTRHCHKSFPRHKKTSYDTRESLFVGEVLEIIEWLELEVVTIMLHTSGSYFG